MRLKIFKPNYLFVILLALGFGGSGAFAQLQGTFTPGQTIMYPTLASIVSALNAQGVSGAVTIQLPAGFSETAPVGGYVLGSEVLNAGTYSLNATRRLRIVKTGTGANPVLTASVGTGATDAIFTIAGADYITIEGVDLRENSANTTDNARMEWGYALLKRVMTNGSIDGVQQVSIRKCNITLNKSNRQAVGIYAGNHAVGALTALVPTSAAGAHRNDTFAGNSIRNVIRGISLTGYIGGSESLLDAGYFIESNVIEDFGHPVSTSGTFPTAAGIFVTGSSSTLIVKNSINNTIGSTTPNMFGALYGIHHGPAIGGNLQVLGNQITLIQDSTVNQQGVYAIRSEIGGAVTGGGTLDANRLVILDNSISARGSYAGGGQFQLISHTGAIRDLNISSNTFRDIHFNGLGNCFFINNAMNNAPANSVIAIRDNRLTGTFRVNGLGSSFSMPGQIIFVNNAGNIAGTTLKVAISGNVFSNFDLSGGNPLKAEMTIGVQDATGGTAAPFPPKHITRNQFANIKGVQFRGFNISKTGALPSDSTSISDNVISNVATIEYGIQLNNASGVIANIHDNRIDSSESVGKNLSQTRGINIMGGTLFHIYNNRISHLSVTHASFAANVYGIHIRNGVNVNVYNNMIGYLGAPNSGNAPDFGVAGINADLGDSIRIYHNTLYMVPASAADAYSVSGILYTETSDMVDIRNNIIHVASKPARGITSAIRRKTGDAQLVPFNLAATTNGNVLYAPTAPNCFLYAENDSANLVNQFTASDFNALCGSYKLFMAPRESNSFYEQNLSQISPGLYAPSGTSYARERGVPTTQPVVTHDIAGVLRSTPPDAGALQFTGTVVPVGGHIEVTVVGAADACFGDSITLSVSPGNATGLIWQRDGSDIPQATDSIYIATESGVYRAVLSYAVGCADTSESVNVAVHPAPQPAITASGNHGEILSTSSYDTYQWQLDGNDLPGAWAQTYTAVVSGDYTVLVTDLNGCTGTSPVQTVDLEAGSVIQTARDFTTISVYPNPVSDRLHVNYPDALQVSILSPDGRRLRQGTFTGSIDVSDLPTGIYLIRMVEADGTGVAQEKIVISR